MTTLLLKCIAIAYGAVAAATAATAEGVGGIPSLDALSAPSSAFSPYRPSVPLLAPLSSGPTMSAAPRFRIGPPEEYHSDTDVAFDFLKGWAAGRVFDPIREAIQGSLEREGYSATESTVGSDILDFAFKWKTTGVEVGDWAGWGATLPAFGKWVAPCVGVIVSMLTCSDTETPEMDDPNSAWNAIYSGIDYSPTGQYVPVNTATPPSNNDDDNSQPDCDSACQQRYADCYQDLQCYCDYIEPGYPACCTLDDSCCDDPDSSLCLSVTLSRSRLLTAKKKWKPRPLMSAAKPQRNRPPSSR